MSGLKELKNRIGSVKSTQKITKAKQMVAAAKLRRAQESAEAARPFAERMDVVLGNLARSVASSANAPKLLAGTGADQTHLLIVATAERGLCGGFNSSIAKLARVHAEKLIAEGMEIMDPENNEEEFIKLATEAVWPKFYDSIGGKDKLDRVLKIDRETRNRKNRDNCEGKHNRDLTRIIRKFFQ